MYDVPKREFIQANLASKIKSVSSSFSSTFFPWAALWTIRCLLLLDGIEKCLLLLTNIRLIVLQRNNFHFTNEGK
jgi:hypothetical protein